MLLCKNTSRLSPGLDLEAEPLCRCLDCKSDPHPIALCSVLCVLCVLLRMEVWEWTWPIDDERSEAVTTTLVQSRAVDDWGFVEGLPYGAGATATG